LTSLPTLFTVQADLDLGRRIAPYIVDSDADVVICRDAVPESLEGEGPEGASYQIRDRRMLIRVPNGPRYLIEDGNFVRYEAADGQDDREIALFLLGSVWGALCYQRGLIPLHASAISTGGAIHAFTGPSGAGKSTLAAALAARGHDFFTDDVLILDPKQLAPEPLCFAGHKDLKLWQDAIAMTGAERGSPVRSVARFDKYYAAPRNESSAIVGRLTNLVILGDAKRGMGPEMKALQGGRAVLQLVSSVYRPAFAEAIMGRRTLFEAIAKLVGRVSVFMFQFRRRFDKEDFAEGVAFVDDWIRNNG
jgi:hypothetical protein